MLYGIFIAARDEDPARLAFVGQVTADDAAAAAETAATIGLLGSYALDKIEVVPVGLRYEDEDAQWMNPGRYHLTANYNVQATIA